MSLFLQYQHDWSSLPWKLTFLFFQKGRVLFSLRGSFLGNNARCILLLQLCIAWLACATFWGDFLAFFFVCFFVVPTKGDITFMSFMKNTKLVLLLCTLFLSMCSCFYCLNNKFGMLFFISFFSWYSFYIMLLWILDSIILFCEYSPYI